MFFQKRHDCTWRDKERFLAAPIDRAISMSWASADDIDKLLYGRTTIVSACTTCGKLSTIEISGISINHGG